MLSLVYAFSNLSPVYRPFVFAENVDIAPFATAWFFLPKATEILVQQVLVTALILGLYFRFHSLEKVMLWYATTFGVAHVSVFFLFGFITPYVSVVTVGAVLSALIFPYFILRVRGGFIYNYVIHFSFYIVLAFFPHLIYSIS